MKSIYFFSVGLNVSLCSYATWQCVEGLIKACKSARIDMVDFGPLDHNQVHVVKYVTVDLISEI